MPAFETIFFTQFVGYAYLPLLFPITKPTEFFSRSLETGSHVLLHFFIGCMKSVLVSAYYEPKVVYAGGRKNAPV